MVFLAVAMVSSLEADDDTDDLVGVGKKNKTKQTTTVSFSAASQTEPKCQTLSDILAIIILNNKARLTK